MVKWFGEIKPGHMVGTYTSLTKYAYFTFINTYFSSFKTSRGINYDCSSSHLKFRTQCQMNKGDNEFKGLIRTLSAIVKNVLL